MRLAAMRDAYYRVLQEDPKFVADLDALNRHVGPAHALWGDDSQWVEELISKINPKLRVRRKPFPAPATLSKRRTKSIRTRPGPPPPLTPAERAAVEKANREIFAFARRWSLPPGYEFEVQESLSFAWPGQPRRLYAVRGELLTNVMPRVRVVTDEVVFDPAAGIREQTKRAVAAFKQDLKEQLARAQRIIEERGWYLSPHLRRRERLHLARRLYRRAVLKWPYTRITQEEARERSESGEQLSAVSVAAVRVSVSEWSRALDVVKEVRAERPPKRA